MPMSPNPLPIPVDPTLCMNPLPIVDAFFPVHLAEPPTIVAVFQTLWPKVLNITPKQCQRFPPRQRKIASWQSSPVKELDTPSGSEEAR